MCIGSSKQLHHQHSIGSSKQSHQQHKSCPNHMLRSGSIVLCSSRRDITLVRLSVRQHPQHCPCRWRAGMHQICSSCCCGGCTFAWHTQQHRSNPNRAHQQQKSYAHRVRQQQRLCERAVCSPDDCMCSSGTNVWCAAARIESKTCATAAAVMHTSQTAAAA